MADPLQRLCADAAWAMSASGAGLSVMADNGVHGMAAASDPRTARVEELQFTLGEGPCIDAFAGARPVLVADLGDPAETRWPMYTPAAQAEGVSAVFAFPLQIGAARLGVLDVFRTRSGPLSRVQLDQAFTFAERIVALLLDGQERASGMEELDEAFEHRASLFQAQGMIMIQLGVPLAEALVRMRALAYTQGRPLSQVAADIVARRLRFDIDIDRI